MLSNSYHSEEKDIVRNDDINLMVYSKEETQVESDKNIDYQNEKYLNFCKALYVTFGFFTLFIAFFSVQNLTTEVQKQNNLEDFGFYLLSILYIFIGIGSLISSAIVKKIGLKNALFVGGLGHLSFVLSQILPAWTAENRLDDINNPTKLQNFQMFIQNINFIKIIMILAVILNGFGAAIIWVAQGEYFQKCATKQTKGFYYGFFISIYQGSQIFGSLFGALIFKFDFNKTQFFSIMSSLALIATLSFLFIQKPLVHESTKKQSFQLSKQSCYFTNDEKSVGDFDFRFQSGKLNTNKNQDSIVYDENPIKIDLKNDDLNSQLLKKNQRRSNSFSQELESQKQIIQKQMTMDLTKKNNDLKIDEKFEPDMKKWKIIKEQNREIAKGKQSFFNDVKITIKLLFSKKMACMIPQILWTGISISYWSGLLSPIMTFEIQNQENISDTQQLSKCLFALVWLGVGEAISGLLMGTIIDCVGSKNACLANIAMLVITIIISIYQIVHDEYGIVSYISCFIWGFQDGIVGTHCMQMLGFEFGNSADPYGVFTLVQGIAVFVFQIVQAEIVDFKTEDNATVDQRNATKQKLIAYTICIGVFGFISLFICFLFFDFKIVKKQNQKKNSKKIKRKYSFDSNNKVNQVLRISQEVEQLIESQNVEQNQNLFEKNKKQMMKSVALQNRNNKMNIFMDVQNEQQNRFGAQQNDMQEEPIPKNSFLFSNNDNRSVAASSIMQKRKKFGVQVHSKPQSPRFKGNQNEKLLDNNENPLTLSENPASASNTPPSNFLNLQTKSKSSEDKEVFIYNK